MLGLALAGALGVSACGSDAKTTATDDGKITVTGTGKKAEVNVKGDRSDLTFNQQKIPKGFPTAVPLPTGLNRIAATSGTTDGTPLFQFTYSLARQNAIPALTRYEAQLKAGGFTIDQPAGSEGAGPSAMITLAATGQGWQVTAASIPGPRPRTLIVSVSP